MDKSDYKFRGHETFYIRKGWLYKGLKNLDKNASVFSDKSINPSDTFGLGVNMIKSLRYWLQAVSLTVEKRENQKSKQELTDLGNIIFKYDKYIEEIGTLCLLHYKLATNNNLATSWSYFFRKSTNTPRLAHFSSSVVDVLIFVVSSFNENSPNCVCLSSAVSLSKIP